jgi:putative sigma-54 modulation protein
MQTTITGRHMDVTPPLRAHIEERLERLTHFYGRIHDVHVVVTRERNRFRAEVTLSVNSHTLVAHEEEDDPRPAVDAAMEKMERRLKTLRDKITDRKGRAPVREATSLDGSGAAESIG